MWKRFGAVTLLILITSLPASAVTVDISNTAVDCAVPVTSPVFLTGQIGKLRTLTFRVRFDPARIRFNDFVINPQGALPDFVPTSRVVEPGVVELSANAGKDWSDSDGMFGSISMTLLTAEPGELVLDVVDVGFVLGLQGVVNGGSGLPGTITSFCPKDTRDRPEVYRFAPLAGSIGGGGFQDGIGRGARFIDPIGVAKLGEYLFVADSRAHTVRRISPDGTVMTWAGAAGEPGRNDGYRTAARFRNPEGLLALPDGSLLVADRGNSAIRQITPDGGVAIWAGTGIPGHRDGARLISQFSAPSALAMEPSGSVLVADPGNCVIRRVSADNVTTLAGVANMCGLENGQVGAATFDGMSAILSHPTLGILVADDRNHVLRRLVAETTVVTYAGRVGEPGVADGLLAQGRFSRPRSLIMLPDESILVGVDNGIRRVAGNMVTTVAGGSSPGWADGSGTAARMSSVAGLVRDESGVIFAADAGNNAVRSVSAAYEVTTLAGSANESGFRDGAGPLARFSRPWQVASDADGNLYVADRANRCIRRITPDGNVTLWAGRPGVSGGEDGPRLNATFQDPAGCAVDPQGNVWVSEPLGHVIRVIMTDGMVKTIVGRRGVAGLVDGPSDRSELDTPMQLAADSFGNVYVADMGNNVIRRATIGGSVSTFAGSLAGLAGGDDGGVDTATFDGPTGVAVSPSGRVIVADRGNHAVRVIADGFVRTSIFVKQPGRADGEPPGARLFEPTGVAVLPDESILVTESSGKLRRIVGRSASTIAGRFDVPGNQAGLGSQTLFVSPVSVAVIGNGTLVVSDSVNDGLVRATRCADDALCLEDSRFAVTLRATDPRTSESAEGSPIAESDLFGFFSLPGLTGNAANPEVFVKVLDGTGVNGKYWVFYGGLTDFEFDLEVRDRLDGSTKTYKKPGFAFCGGADTGAFGKGAVALPLRSVTTASVVSAVESGGCDESLLCLTGDRFQVEISAKDPRTGAVAPGQPIPRTDDFGYFSLPGLTGNASNPEVFVKVLDGRGVNGKYWVFYGGLTDFEVTVTVTDAETGAKRVYVKPGLEFCGGADTNAF